MIPAAILSEGWAGWLALRSPRAATAAMAVPPAGPPVARTCRTPDGGITPRVQIGCRFVYFSLGSKTMLLYHQDGRPLRQRSVVEPSPARSPFGYIRRFQVQPHLFCLLPGFVGSGGRIQSSPRGTVRLGGILGATRFLLFFAAECSHAAGSFWLGATGAKTLSSVPRGWGLRRGGPAMAGSNPALAGPATN